MGLGVRANSSFSHLIEGSDLEKYTVGSGSEQRNPTSGLPAYFGEFGAIDGNVNTAGFGGGFSLPPASMTTEAARAEEQTRLDELEDEYNELKADFEIWRAKTRGGLLTSVTTKDLGEWASRLGSLAKALTVVAGATKIIPIPHAKVIGGAAAALSLAAQTAAWEAEAELRQRKEDNEPRRELSRPSDRTVIPTS